MGTNPLKRGTSQYIADFETATNEEILKVHPVWCWAVADVDTVCVIRTGHTIDEFMEWVSNIDQDSDVYFHNLKFDGEFIVYWLLSHDYKPVEVEQYNQKEPGNFFTCVISGTGAWYAIKIHQADGKEFTIKDSLKRIPLKVSAIPKAYGLDVTKGEIDHNIERGPGYEPTAEEWDYVKRDVLVVAKALAINDKENMERVTVGSNALFYYKTTLTKQTDYTSMRRAFFHLFPQLKPEEDDFIRRSYLGGWVYANPKYKGEMVKAGRVYDVNSMYPGVMKKYAFPYGRPVMSGMGRVPERYLTDDYIYFQRAMFRAKLKPGAPPTLKIRDSYRYYWNKYIEDTGRSPRTGNSCDPYVTATLSNVDWQLLQEFYDVGVVAYTGYYVFKAKRGLFDDYIDFWTEQKIKAGKEGNMGLRTIAKLYLNNLYGKFGTNPQRTDKVPYMDEDGKVKYVTKDSSLDISGYIPVAAMVTSYARREVTMAAYNNFDRFLYADTDSLHLLGDYDPVGMVIDPYELGAWDNEAVFTRAKYLGSKCYAEEIEGKWKITVAGMPEECKRGLDVEKDFKIGYVAHGKLIPKRYPGGVVLQETSFELKER